ncbi:unnamed protein product [Victoria cruziana]
MSGADAIHLLPSTRSFMADSNPALNHQQQDDQPPVKKKKKRNLPGTPDPDAEVIALSPRTLMATNRFVCEICNKGFQRDQNLQLHRRGHNLPWKLRQRSSKEVRKRVYICPEKTCVHHDPSRALGDLTGIKKHFSRKHGEKKWKCEKCSKKYAVQSDWKAHTKTCGTREYKCDCGTLFSRKDSFITHRAFCDALAEESARLSTGNSTNINFKNDSLNSSSHLVGSPSSPASRATMSRGSVNQFCPILQPGFVAADAAAATFASAADLLQRQPGKEGVSPLIDQSIDVGANSSSYFPDTCKPVAGSTVSQRARSGYPPELVQLASAAAETAAPPEFGGCFPSLWMNRTNSSARTVANLSLSTSSVTFIDEMVKNQQLGSSLASSYNASQNQKVMNSSHMSATALLQKAAQMGATTSNPSLVRSFGVASSKASAVPPHDGQATNEFQLLGQSTQPENFQEFMRLLPAANGNGVFNDASMSSFVDSSPTLAGLTMLCSRNGQLKLQRQGQETDRHGMTRDFLGVGDPSGRFSEQELASFASIRSTMNLKAYGGNDS